jgi:hypothetical protein
MLLAVVEVQKFLLVALAGQVLVVMEVLALRLVVMLPLQIVGLAAVVVVVETMAGMVLTALSF